MSSVTPAEDALVAACRVVGRASGIAILAPAGDEPVTLDTIAWASHVRVRRVLLREGWWARDCGPLLAQLELEKRPVALIPRGPGSYEVFDPTDGSRAAVGSGTATRLAPHAHTLYRPFAPGPLGIAGLARFGLRDARRDGLRLIAIGVLWGLIGLAAPVATGLLFDYAVPSGDKALLLALVAGVVLASLASAVVEIARGLSLVRIEQRLSATAQAALWDRVLRLPLRFFRLFSAGELAERILAVEIARHALTGAALSAVLGTVFSVFSLAVLFRYSVPLALLALALLGLSLAVSIALGRARLRADRETAAVRGRLAGEVLQWLSALSKLRVAAAEDRILERWQREFRQGRTLADRAAVFASVLLTWNAAFSVSATLALFAATVALRRRSAGGLSPGDFLAFSSAFSAFAAFATQLVQAGLSVLGALPSLERTRPLLEAEAEVRPEHADPGELRGAIEFRGVSFAYGRGEPRVLDDVSFSVMPGALVAVVGPSGSGKSTLVKLLLGIERPDSGAVLYDGRDLAELDVEKLRRRIGLVLQAGTVSPGSLLRNIVGTLPLGMDDAWAAARAAGLEGEIQALPMGMHTVVGQGGSTLSGGQRQRLLIARALAGRPRVLVLDEATSALDNRTQAIVAENLRALAVTRVVIAHRLSTVVGADQILVLDQGRLVERGRYEELLARGGLFTELVARQRG